MFKRIAFAGSLICAVASAASFAAGQSADDRTTGEVIGSMVIGKDVCGFEYSVAATKFAAAIDNVRLTPTMKLGAIEAAEVFKKLQSISGRSTACAVLRESYSKAFR